MPDRLTFWLIYFFGLCLAVWLGSMIFFSVTAQIPFQALSSRHVAGTITSSMLARLDHSGPFLGGMLVVLCVVIAQRLGRAPAEFSLLLVMLVAMTVIPIISGHIISPRLLEIRSSAPGGVIDNVLPTDPIRVAFNRLHIWSVSLLMANILLGAASLAAAFRLFFPSAKP